MVEIASSAALVLLAQLAKQKDGQDLVEYALVVALIAFAATAGMKTIASSINNVLQTVGDTITSAST